MRPPATDRRQADLARLIARELRLASVGMSQREIARRSGMTQSAVSRAFSGRRCPTFAVLLRLSEAVGHRLSIKLYPEAGVGLRDSGQLELADVIRTSCHAVWRLALEVPVARPPDRRAADMLLLSTHEANMIEIERGLFDFQAQYRAAALKREAMVERLGRPVNLLIGVPDTPVARRRLAPHAALVSASLRTPSARAWAAIRSGTSVGGDALLWIRKRSAPSRPPLAPDAQDASDGAKRA
jgi:transcriptional regulator with XRE-family HTH domain